PQRSRRSAGGSFARAERGGRFVRTAAGAGGWGSSVRDREGAGSAGRKDRAQTAGVARRSVRFAGAKWCEEGRTGRGAQGRRKAPCDFERVPRLEFARTGVCGL